MRKPSINIYVNDLKVALKKNYPEIDFRSFNKVLEDLKSKQIKRIVVCSTKDFQKIKGVVNDNVSLFENILFNKRSINNKYARKILSTDKAYKTLVKVVADAELFCETYNLKLDKGFLIYIEIGLLKIGKNYGVNKFVTYKDYIFSNYENSLLKKSMSKKDVYYLIDIYLGFFKSNFDSKYKRIVYDNYGHDFIYAKLQSNEFNAEWVDWVSSQFKGLEFLNVKPEPYQLHGLEAEKRYTKQSKNVKNSVVGDWRSKILNKIV